MKKTKVGKTLPMPGMPREQDGSPTMAGPAASGLNLANHFLIAMPSIQDPVFGGTVVYVCEHNDKGVLGVVINKPTDMTMETLFDRVDLKLARACAPPSSTSRSCSAAPSRTTVASCCIRLAGAIRRR